MGVVEERIHHSEEQIDNWTENQEGPNPTGFGRKLKKVVMRVVDKRRRHRRLVPEKGNTECPEPRARPTIIAEEVQSILPN